MPPAHAIIHIVKQTSEGHYYFLPQYSYSLFLCSYIVVVTIVVAITIVYNYAWWCSLLCNESDYKKVVKIFLAVKDQDHYKRSEHYY